MNIGIIGLGRVFNHYLTNFLTYEFITKNNLILFDKNSEITQKYREKLACQSANSFEEIINFKPNFVIISSPSGLHFQHAKFFLENNINVLSEKPICMSINEQIELTNLAKKNNLNCGVIFQNRLNRSIKLLKSIVEDGFLGKINICSMKLYWSRDQSYYKDDWHGRWKMDGGVINQQAIHHIDALQWVNGPIKKVFAMEGNLLNDLEAEDTMMACVNFENNSLGTIEATTAFRPRDYEASITISGDKGFIKVGGIALNKIIDYSFLDCDPEIKNLIEKSSEEVNSGYGNSHIKVIDNFINSLSNKRDFLIDIESTINTTKVIHALYRSSESNKLVNTSKEESNRLGK